jgi:LPXTG-motif cell wall-anchored protein
VENKVDPKEEETEDSKVLGEEAATGDAFNISWVLILALIAVIGSAVVFTLRRKGGNLGRDSQGTE